MISISLDEFLDDYKDHCSANALPEIWTDSDGVLMVNVYLPGDPEWEEHDKKFHKNLEEITTRYAEAIKRMPKW